MRTGSLVMAVSPGFDTRDFVLQSSLLLYVCSAVSSFGLEYFSMLPRLSCLRSLNED